MSFKVLIDLPIREGTYIKKYNTGQDKIWCIRDCSLFLGIISTYESGKYLSKACDLNPKTIKTKNFRVAVFVSHFNCIQFWAIIFLFSSISQFKSRPFRICFWKICNSICLCQLPNRILNLIIPILKRFWDID